jgi:diguanylate cyclase (GGDEF)-like protein
MQRERGTWLCPDPEDRARVIENSGRVARARRLSSLAVAVTLVYLAPTYGWWLIGLLALSALNLETVDRRMRRSARPEFHAATSVLFSLCIVGAAIAFSGGSRSPLLALMAVPTAFAATRFRPRVVMLGTGVALGALLVATFGSDPAGAIARPATVIVTMAVIVGVAAATAALQGAELYHRSTAILDPLTGLLNRQGLEGRVQELAEQARQTGAPISLLVCDVDNFKGVNDSHGHAAGDAVLRDVAYALRKQLRSFELIYRMGGEEFLVVLPGVTLHDARELGERLCEATRRCRSQGISLTLSVGVGTRWGADAQFQNLFEAADQAMYRAKAEGRDRVSTEPLRATDPRTGTPKETLRPALPGSAAPDSLVAAGRATALRR